MRLQLRRFVWHDAIRAPVGVAHAPVARFLHCHAVAFAERYNHTSDQVAGLLGVADD